MARQPESLQQALHDPLRAGPDWDSMSDEQIMGLISRDEAEDKYAIPEHMVPDGMAYQWVRCEVFGKPDFNRPAEMEQKGWRTVPASRHPGRYMAADQVGPIELDGMRLYEMPRRVVRLKRELAAKVAHQKVSDMNQQMIYSPAGTAPRVPGKGGPTGVRHETGSMPMVIE